MKYELKTRLYVLATVLVIDALQISSRGTTNMRWNNDKIFELPDNFGMITPRKALSTPIDSENEGGPSEVLLAIVMGIAITIFFFVIFMICAESWDKWITRKLATRTVYITPHFGEEGSSHLSEVILSNGSSVMSSSTTREDHGSDESSVRASFNYIFIFMK